MRCEGWYILSIGIPDTDSLGSVTGDSFLGLLDCCISTSFNSFHLMQLETEKMLKILLLCFLLLVSSQIIAAAPKRRKSSSSTKSSASSTAPNGDDVGKLLLTKMRSLNIIPLTDSNFSKFTSQKSRDYSAIVMFTDFKVDHEACVKSSVIFSEVAENYRNQFDFNTSSKLERLAFFIVDLHSGMRIFQGMGLEYIPRFFIYPVESAHLAPVEVALQKVLDGLPTFTTAITEMTGIKVLCAESYYP